MIEVHHLCKTYRRQKRESGLMGAVRYLFKPEYEDIPAVRDVSFQINKGEMVAYIGPNGAGKSTTIKMLVGILVPTSGEITVAGVVPHEDRMENAKRIGVIFGQRTRLWWDIPVSDSFELVREMYEIPANTYKQNLELFGDVLGIGDFIDTPVRQLSLGQRMRADLCNALLHNPEILYLDEPTIGLDVEVKEKVRSFIKTVNRERQTTVILTTHDMADIEKLCERVIVIDKGTLMFDGSLNKLKHDFGGQEGLTIQTDQILNSNVLDTLGARPGVGHIDRDGAKLHCTYDRRQINSADILQQLMQHTKVVNFTVHATETEDVIRNLYKANAALATGEVHG